jgi:hypothetical protein
MSRGLRAASRQNQGLREEPSNRSPGGLARFALGAEAIETTYIPNV